MGLEFGMILILDHVTERFSMSKREKNAFLGRSHVYEVVQDIITFLLTHRRSHEDSLSYRMRLLLTHIDVRLVLCGFFYLMSEDDDKNDLTLRAYISVCVVRGNKGFFWMTTLDEAR